MVYDEHSSFGMLVNKLGVDALESVQSTLSHLITTSVSRAMFAHFLVEHGVCQYYLYWIDLPGGWIT